MSPSPNSPPPAGNPGGTKLILVALTLAIAAVIITNVYIAQVKKKVQGESFVVYRLTRSVKPGHRLARQDVQEVQMPQQFQDSFRGFVDQTGLESRVGDTIRRAADQNEFLTYQLFTIPDTVNDANQITAGMRLVAIPVNSRTAPGALRPGMFVDIEAPFDTGGVIPIVMPVMERVKVMAMGSLMEGDESTGSRTLSTYRTITVELSPEEATHMAMIKLAASGDFELQLRNPTDPELRKIKRGGINPEVLELVVTRARTAPVRRGSPGTVAQPGPPAVNDPRNR